MPSRITIKSPISTAGISVVAPTRAATHTAIGRPMKCQAKAEPQTHPMNGRQPATNRSVDAASTLFTSVCICDDCRALRIASNSPGRFEFRKFRLRLRLGLGVRDYFIEQLQADFDEGQH